MTYQKNTILAIALSALVLIAWQYFFGLPQMEKQKQIQQQQQQQQQTTQPTQQAPASSPDASPQRPAQVPGTGTTELSRQDALARSPQRVRIETPRLAGSI